MINSLPNILCLDDKDISTKERGVAGGVAGLCSKNSGRSMLIYVKHASKGFVVHTDLLRVAELEMKISSIEGLPVLKVMI